MKLATVILAAGKGKRMNNPDRSKVMFSLAGRPMIEYVTELALDVGSDKIVIVVWHKRESVIEFVSNRFTYRREDIHFATQEAQLGTGHAVIQAEEMLEDFDGDVLILSGDVPLLRRETIERLVAAKKIYQWTACLISGISENPFGYGRILRDGDGAFRSIREEKDASEAEKAVQEINSGIYLVDAKKLFEALSMIKTDNIQWEYYLTDIFEYFLSSGASIGAISTNNLVEISGINTIEQLEWLEKTIAFQKNNWILESYVLK